jgi:hypothetical protein
VATRRSTPRFAEAPDLFVTAPPEAEAAAIGVEGHRLRLRERFLSAGPEALGDHEMLDPGAVSSNHAGSANEINHLSDADRLDSRSRVTCRVTSDG